jgi:pimeloyl-ACP methyl ester carboxylesterase
MTAGVGLPSEIVARMKAMPMWTSLEALAHTLAYDGTLMGGTQSGKPLPTERWAGAKAPTLVLCGGASDPWLHAGSTAIADLLPGAELLVLEGLDHSAAVTRPQALAPVLIEFLDDR